MTRKATDEEIALVVRAVDEGELKMWVGWCVSAEMGPSTKFAKSGTLDEVFTAAADFITNQAWKKWCKDEG